MNLGDVLYPCVKQVGKLMLLSKYGKLPNVQGCDNIPEPPFIIVANYLETYEGPLAVAVSLPMRLYPWVLDIWLDKERAITIAKEGFFGNRLGHNFISYKIATAYATVYSTILNTGEVIPVYRDPKTKRATDRTNETYELSVDALLEGKPLLVMPENRDEPSNEHGVKPFKKGAAKISSHYFQRQGHSPELLYLPIGVSNINGDINISEPIVVKEDFMTDPHVEVVLTSALENRVKEMCVEMNKE